MFRNLPLLLSAIPFFVLANDPSACVNMQGQYQRIKSTQGIQDNKELSVYLKHIDNTNNGYYGIIDFKNYQQTL
ncbi:hypothetical protein [Yersinia aleksiciae]|uniref:Uncharacterized protein n=1 Tax=Yersinia aleksiciae TaxID=263819 RepID=A0ABN4H9D5_YERAE|nr:hypothetical protein [Yersinia aleksiciae]AKP33031.1 hypothetical protein ACZ76_05485 [Yersinia aleksiciae]CFQ58259.1 Uncharacterised protein [Yersinia aleksiciae]